MQDPTSAENADSYLVTAKEGNGKYTEKMSRFLSFALPMTDPSEAKEIIKTYTNRFHDARHVCWAYIVGPDAQTWQLNDNGEPSGTAGKPILGQIRSAQLTDTLVVVVRYFGGIKLGTSGLISAYREAARLAIEDAGKEVRYRGEELEVTFPYMSMNEVMKIAKMPGIEIIDQQFDNTCKIKLLIRQSLFTEAEKRLLSVDGVTKTEMG